jgi:hypothetical protein
VIVVEATFRYFWTRGQFLIFSCNVLSQGIDTKERDESWALYWMCGIRKALRHGNCSQRRQGRICGLPGFTSITICTSSATAWCPVMSRQRYMATRLSPGISSPQCFTRPVLLAASHCVQDVRNLMFKLLKLYRLILKVLMRFVRKENAPCRRLSSESRMLNSKESTFYAKKTRLCGF